MSRKTVNEPNASRHSGKSVSTRELMQKRARLLGAKAPLFYDDPVHIVRGEGVWLYDAAGKKYLDVYNNVANVGHCHPHVVEALHRQSQTLNVHTRYLHELILEYVDRLTQLHADPLSMAFIVCTGSEANDIALRMARRHTGKGGIICTNFTYHGNTATVDELASLFHGGRSISPNVKTVPFPETYRPLDDLSGNDLSGDALADAYGDKVKQAIDKFEAEGVGFAGMLICSIFANEGLPNVPGRCDVDALIPTRAAMCQTTAGMQEVERIRSLSRAAPHPAVILRDPERSEGDRRIYGGSSVILRGPERSEGNRRIYLCIGIFPTIDSRKLVPDVFYLLRPCSRSLRSE